MKREELLRGAINTTRRYIKKNSATILTCIGAAGVVATTVTAVKATPKAMRLLEEAKEEKSDELTRWEIVKTAAPSYIPAFVLGSASIACIFGANVINKRTQASIASAYVLLDQSFKDYKKKATALYGEEATDHIRQELAKDKYDEDDISLDVDDGKNLFYDEFSQRYYRATNEAILRAEYEINKMLSTHGGASLNDYYDLIGVTKVDYGDYIGWSSGQMMEMHWDSWLYFNHTKVETDDGLECWIIGYTEPFIDFHLY